MTDVEPDPLVAAAKAGDEAAFAALVERHRRELHVHCYRMLGSFEEAEDLVQETFLRAWRSRESFAGGPGFRAWLYRIATNASLDAIRSRSRRVASLSSFAEVPWLQPYPDRLLDEVAPERGRARRGRRRPRDDRADLPGRHPAAAARSSGPSSSCATCSTGRPPRPPPCSTRRWPPPTARCSAPGRRCASSSPSARPTARASADLSADERALLQGFIDTHERGDAAAAAALLRDDVRVTMPPHPLSLRGHRRDRSRCMRRAFGPPTMGDWRLVPTRANRQPAAASYLRRPGDSVYRAFKLDVLRVEDGAIAEITTFGSDLFAAFGLAETL